MPAQHKINSEQLRRLLPHCSFDPIGEHFVDDPEMLERWLAQTLSDEETERIASHLLHCSHCQEGIAEFYVLGLFENNDKQQLSPALALPGNAAVSVRKQHRLWWMVSAAAVCLIAVGLCLFYGGMSDADKLNRQLMQRRGMMAAVALEQRGGLSHYGLSHDGFSMTKSGSVALSPEEEALLAEYDEAVRDFPGHRELALNYAQLLLEIGRLDDAMREFDTVLRSHPADINALLGRGIILFKYEEFTDAFECFQQVLKKRPHSVPCLLNAAACRIQLDDVEGARIFWNRAKSLTTDRELIGQIDEMIKESEGTIL